MGDSIASHNLHLHEYRFLFLLVKGLQMCFEADGD